MLSWGHKGVYTKKYYYATVTDAVRVLLPKFQKAEMSHGAVKSHIVRHAAWMLNGWTIPHRRCGPDLLSGQFNYIIMKLALWCLHGTGWFTYAGDFNSKCTNITSDGQDRWLFNSGEFTFWILIHRFPFSVNYNPQNLLYKVRFVTTLANYTELKLRLAFLTLALRRSWRQRRQ